MTITEIIFTEDDDLKIWEILNEYRQFRLTATTGVYEIKKLLNEMVNAVTTED